MAEVEKLIPRPARQEFSLLMWSAWLEAKLVELPRAQAASAVTRRRFAAQWTARKQTLRALDMRATVDRDEFFRFQHGDGRTKLIERLAAAYRAGEIPGYMLKFVDSLRTRAKSNTSQSVVRSASTKPLTTTSLLPPEAEKDDVGERVETDQDEGA